MRSGLIGVALVNLEAYWNLVSLFCFLYPHR
jgi:hypothetical protein